MSDLEALLDNLIAKRISEEIPEDKKDIFIQSVKEDFLNFLVEAYVQNRSNQGKASCSGKCSGGGCHAGE